MRHNVCAPFKRATVDGRGEGVVHEEGHAVGMSKAGEAFDVKDVAAGIRDGFTEDTLRVRAEERLDFFVGRVGVKEGALDAHLFHRHAKEIERAAVDGVGGEEVVAGFADVEDGIERRSLSAGGQHRTDAALERSNLGRHGIVGRVLKTRVEIAAVLEVEQSRHLLAVVIFKGGALIDGKHARFSLLGLPARLHTKSGGFHE